eukprot:IDg4254t1
MVGRRLSFREGVRLDAAIDAVKAGMSVRTAESVFRIAKTTVHRHATAPQSTKGNIGRRPAFSADEEAVVVDLISDYAARGIPLSRTQLQDAFA